MPLAWLLITCATSVVPAAADPPFSFIVDSGSTACRFTTFQHDDVTTPDTFTGFAEGVAIAMASPPGTMSCEVRIGGSMVASTLPMHGSGILYTAGQVTFTRSSETDVVELCTVIIWDVGHPPSDSCGDTTSQEAPPQEIADAAHPATATFEGDFSEHVGDSNYSSSCFDAGLFVPGATCEAGFVTPASDLCERTSEITTGWWTSGGLLVFFDLSLMGNGVLEGISRDEGSIIYEMHIQANTPDCGGVDMVGSFIGQMRAV